MVMNPDETTDLEFMQNPDEWPNTFLPLKKSGTWEFAILMCGGDNDEFYMLGEGQSMFKPLDPALFTEPFPKEELQERVIDRDWVVD